MRKTIRSLEKEIRQMEVWKDEWRDKFYIQEKENLKLRLWIIEKFDWWLELISNGQKPCLKYLIKNTAEILGMKK